MDKLEEMKAAIEAFCAKEYKHDRSRMSGSDFRLFAVDGGGYDCADDVTLDINGDDITLTVVTSRTRDYQPKTKKTFKLKVTE